MGEVIRLRPKQQASDNLVWLLDPEIRTGTCGVCKRQRVQVRRVTPDDEPAAWVCQPCWKQAEVEWKARRAVELTAKAKWLAEQARTPGSPYYDDGTLDDDEED